jgi:flavin reductase (DIM6/NTAB) family NADH-FMN oxidoreductase RutF
MTVAFRPAPAPETVAATLKDAMRHLAGGVSVITAGVGDERTGLTVTSAVSLSMDPPTMMISVNRGASAWPIINRERHFAVNILGAQHQHVADRFAGRGGVKGVQRYEGARWRALGSGASGLEDALAVIDCAVEEIIERHSHGIVIGVVRSVHLGEGAEALVYGHGRYRSLSLA